MKHHCRARIAPSLLSCDLSRLAEDAQRMLDLGADWLVGVEIAHELRLSLERIGTRSFVRIPLNG